MPSLPLRIGLEPFCGTNEKNVNPRILQENPEERTSQNTK
jgi:hypothetical protein